MNKQVSFKFFVYQRTPDDKARLYVRILCAREKTEFGVGYTVDLSDWNEQKQRCYKNKGLNEELSFIENKLLEIKRNLSYSGKEISAKLIKDIYQGKDKVNQSLIAYYESFIEKMKKRPQEYSSVVVEKHQNTLNKVRAFLVTRQHKDIKFEEINHTWVADFDHYLMTFISPSTNRPIGRGTANKQHSWLKSILLKAIREDLLKRNPYTEFKLKAVKGNREHLTEEELDLIAQHDLANHESLHRVRDIFFFSVYTGLRYSDAMSLRIEHIVKDKAGKYWISLVQEKTNEPVLTPMLKPAVVIFNKYDNMERKVKGFVLPRMSNQKINIYLKTIAELVGINKKLSHHVARHTFATTVTLSNEIPLEVVSKWLGHTSLKTSQIYAKITKQYSSKMADRLDKKL